MALDSQAKRMSAVAISLYAAGSSVLPDGSFDQGDRQAIGYGYLGFNVGSPPGTGVPLVNSMFYELIDGGLVFKPSVI